MGKTSDAGPEPGDDRLDVDGAAPDSESVPSDGPEEAGPDETAGGFDLEPHG